MPDTVAIAGYGDAYVDEGDETSPLELAVEAVRNALEDANIDIDAIDSVLTGRRPIADYRPQWNNILASYLSIPTRHSTQVTNHLAGVTGTLKHAYAAIESGMAETVLCVASDSAASAGDSASSAEAVTDLDVHETYEAPYGPSMPGIYGLFAQRHMHEYGTTREQAARVAVEARKWGTRHPEATMSGKEEISVQDVLDARTIAEPFGLLDCAPFGPAGTAGAMIVTSSDRAEDCQPNPVYVRGVGEYNTHEKVTERMALRDQPPHEDGPDLTTTGAREAARQAYSMANLTSDDVDVVEPSMPFSGIGVLLLEDLGFCEKGEGGAFVANGGIDFDGGLPVNTNGGWLSFGQPIISGPMDLIVEGVRQLRGEALGVQVPGADVALAHGVGGPLACHSVALLSTKRGRAGQ